MAKPLLLVALYFSTGIIASPLGIALSTPLPPATSASSPPDPTPPTLPPVDTSTLSPLTLPPTPTSDDCRTRTVCVDGVNDCGQPWGTCIPDCEPWNIVTPPCTTFTPPPMCADRDPDQGIWLCKDFIDACHQMYGGCYDVCKAEPSWYTPPCDKPWPTDGNIWGEPEPTSWEPKPEPTSEPLSVELKPEPEPEVWDGPRPVPNGSS